MSVLQGAGLTPYAAKKLTLFEQHKRVNVLSLRGIEERRLARDVIESPSREVFKRHVAAVLSDMG